ncbi:MAG: GNAT family N-acetyltransferase [Euryarchaeota archaeon]|nr:GNAT family N-acetyltransferase [Euryarchaeota archaeon]
MPSRLPALSLPIETPRLSLRLPSRGDLPDLTRSFRDPRTARAAGAYLHSRTERDRPALIVSRTLKEYRRGEHLSLSVVLPDPTTCIGRVGLRDLDWTHRKVQSLSFWIDPKHWGRGYATEAAWYLCDAAFRHLGMRRVGSSALEKNLASLAVHQRLGFVEEGREREAICVKGRCMDMVLFGLLDRELPSWERVSKRSGLSDRPA